MPLPDTARPLEKATLRDAIYETLHEWIVDGTLHPGERVRDAELAEHLGVSRTPVREALQQLAHEGLVETTANRWTRIAPLNIAGADHLYPIVWALDALAVRLAAPRFGAAERDAMADASTRLDKALERHDSRAALAADADFHGVVAGASDNPDLGRMLTGLRAQLRRLELAYFDAGLGQASVDEHAKILAALSAGDHEGAVAAAGEHWQRSLERFHASASDEAGGLAAPAATLST
jgi:DNA-binding GntR family transcriptional regulator